MKFEVKNLESELGFGTGIYSDDGNYEYEQLRPDLDWFSNRLDEIYIAGFDDNFLDATVRIYKKDIRASQHTPGAHPTGYEGVIMMPRLSDDNDDYKKFRDITDYLNKLTGKTVENSKAHYAALIEQDKTYDFGDVQLIHRITDEGLPDNLAKLVLRNSHKVGFICDAVAYLAGFGIMRFAEMGSIPAIITYACAYPIIEIIIAGAISSCVLQERNDELRSEFICPTHALGFLPCRSAYKDSIKKGDDFIERFDKANLEFEKAQIMGASFKEISRRKKDFETSLAYLEEIFEYSCNQRGFYLTYQSTDKDRIIDLFENIMYPEKRKATPARSAPENAEKNESKKQKKGEETKAGAADAASDMPNPWDVQVDDDDVGKIKLESKLAKSTNGILEKQGMGDGE